MEVCSRVSEIFGHPLNSALRSCVEEAEELLVEQLDHSLGTNQRLALVSLLVDVLEGHVDGEFEGSVLLNYLNSREFNLAAAEFQTYANRNGRLVKAMWDRRQKEMGLFLTEEEMV